MRNPVLGIEELTFFWFFANGAGTLLLAAFLTRRVRAVRPLVLAFMVVGVTGAFLAVTIAGSDALARRAEALEGAFRREPYPNPATAPRQPHLHPHHPNHAHRRLRRPTPVKGRTRPLPRPPHMSELNRVAMHVVHAPGVTGLIPDSMLPERPPPDARIVSGTCMRRNAPAELPPYQLLQEYLAARRLLGEIAWGSTRASSGPSPTGGSRPAGGRPPSWRPA